MLNPLEIEFEVTQADIDASRYCQRQCNNCLIARVLQRTLNNPRLRVGLSSVYNHNNESALYCLDERGRKIRELFDYYEIAELGAKFSLVEKVY